MAEADGRIVIDTAIDTSGVTAGGKNIEAAVKKTAARLERIVNQAKANMQVALSSGAPASLDAELKQTSAALNDATNKLQNFVEFGGKADMPAFKFMLRDVETLQAKLAQLQAQKNAMNASDAPMGGGGTEQNTYRLGNAFASLRARIAEYVRESKTAQSVQLLFSRSMGAINGAVNGLRGKLQQAVASIKNYISHTQKVKKSSSIGAKGMAMLGLGVSSLLGALSGLRQGMIDGLQNLSKFDKGSNAALSSMKSSLSQVKNSLATAFSPILTAIAPAINTLLGLISKALNAIGEFVAALTGQSTFTRATAVQENFAESLGGTASAAKEAQKQMSGLDEMTTWQSKSSGGGGGGGGGAGAGAFETVDITNSPIANFANQIKDMIAKQDFRGVGDLVAQKMNAAIGSWDGAGAGKRLSDGIKGALDTAIGFLQGTDWQNMGRQVANFITAIDWSGITSRLFEGLGSVLGGIAGFIWGLISDAWGNVVSWWRDVAIEDGKFTMAGLLNGIWEGIKGIGTWIYDHIFKPFVDGFCKAFGIHSPSSVLYDLGLNIVQGLINAVKSIPQKAKQIFESARSGIKNVLNSISSFLGSTFKTDWSKKIGALGDPLNALLTNIKNIWNNGIKPTFNGIVTFIKGVFTGDWKKAWTGVQTAFSGVFSTLKSIAKAPLNSIIGLINGLITALNSMIRGLNKIKVNIPSWVPGLGGQSIGFNIPQISKVPYLATGAVIPPNAPFTAVLGDQRHGTNLEAPESLIRQIVREEAGRGGSWTFTAQINRRTLFREIIEEAKLQQARTGKDPFALA